MTNEQSPRQHVIAQIEALTAEGAKGEEILRMIESHVFAYSDTEKKLAFVRTSFGFIAA